jgi:hypothetical protein
MLSKFPTKLFLHLMPIPQLNPPALHQGIPKPALNAGPVIQQKILPSSPPKHPDASNLNLEVVLPIDCGHRAGLDCRVVLG